MAARRVGPLRQAVQQAIDALQAGDTDQGTAQLALTYAREVDAGGDLEKLGPLLLACLAQMLMTPAARAAAMKGVRDAGKPGPSPLDELRARRTRKRPAEDLDAAAT